MPLDRWDKNGACATDTLCMPPAGAGCSCCMCCVWNCASCWCCSYEKVAPASLCSVEGSELVKTIFSDASASCGRGAALDCQQGLSPLYARPSQNAPPGGEGEQCAETAYRSVDVPVALWYGTADDSVPLATADWLYDLLPVASKHYVNAGHGLYLTFSEEVFPPSSLHIGMYTCGLLPLLPPARF